MTIQKWLNTTKVVLNSNVYNLLLTSSEFKLVGLVLPVVTLGSDSGGVSGEPSAI